MVTIVLALIGLVIGAAMAGEEGMVFGLFIGIAFGMISSLKGRVFTLEQELTRVLKLLNHSRTKPDEVNPTPEQNKVDIAEPIKQTEPVKQAIQSVAQTSTDDFLAQLNITNNEAKPQPQPKR